MYVKGQLRGNELTHRVCNGLLSMRHNIRDRQTPTNKNACKIQKIVVPL